MLSQIDTISHTTVAFACAYSVLRLIMDCKHKQRREDKAEE